MAKIRGTSSAPMILGIIGGLMGIPASFCAGACVAGIGGAAGAADASEIGTFYLGMCLVGSLMGLVFGFLSKRSPKLSGIMLILAAMMTGFTLIAGNMIALICGILFLIAGAISLAQKTEVVVE